MLLLLFCVCVCVFCKARRFCCLLSCSLKNGQKGRLVCFGIKKCTRAQTLKIYCKLTTQICFPTLSEPPHKFHLFFHFLFCLKEQPRSAALLPKPEKGCVSRNRVGVSSWGGNRGRRAGLQTKCPLHPGCPGQPRLGFMTVYCCVSCLWAAWHLSGRVRW